MENKTALYNLHDGAGIGPCIDAKAHKGLIYAIQNVGRLCVLKPNLELIHTYEGIGNARQIEMIDDVAVISARENGIWIFDLSREKPELLSHYHTVEYAVGVALCGNLAFVSCRQYGVEVIDISDPRHPSFVSLIRIGEVQSAAVCDNVLYCGVWGEMKVVLVDVTNPASAFVISEIPLWGRGDGVCVENGILYAATGQHGRGIVNVIDENDPQFGNGNGVECFDVSDPARPKRINGKKFNRAYSITVDMWEAALYGDTLVVNDSELGVYGLSSDDLKERFVIKPANGDAVTGVTCFGGDMFVATGRGDLYAVRGLGLSDQKPNQVGTVFPAVPAPFAYSGDGVRLSVCYDGSFPVLAMDSSERFIVLACAEGGVHVLDKATAKLRYIIKTACEAVDVSLCGERLFVCEGLGGVEVFSLSEDVAERIGGLRDQKAVNQIKLSRSGRYLMCALATDTLKMYDVGDASAISCKYEYRIRKGQLYGDNFASNFLCDGTMISFCHRDGFIFTDPDGGDGEFHRIEYVRRNGFCGYCATDGIETDGENIFYTLDGGYVLLSRGHKEPFMIDELELCKAVSGFNGILTFYEKGLIASNRSEGKLYIIDASDVKAPRIISNVRTNASVSKARLIGKRVFIPGGRYGLLELER